MNPISAVQYDTPRRLTVPFITFVILRRIQRDIATNVNVFM